MFRQTIHPTRSKTAPKRTAVEYEAMIGGLKRQLDDAEDRAINATHQWEQWQARAEGLARGTVEGTWKPAKEERALRAHVEELEAVLSAIEVHGTRGVVAGWVSVPETEWDQAMALCTYRATCAEIPEK